MQYSLVAKSLLTTALGYLDKEETRERLRRTENSSQIFGLVPRREASSAASDLQSPLSDQSTIAVGVADTGKGGSTTNPPRSTQVDGRTARPSFDFESTFAGMAESLPRTPGLSIMSESLDFDSGQVFDTLNLFPLLETDGHIDLANYF